MPDSLPRNPAPEKARNGEYAALTLARNAPALVLWADLFNVRTGHRIVLSIRGPDGRTVSESTYPVEKDQARLFIFSGKPLKGSQWPAGDYEGVIRLEGGDGASGAQPPTMTVRAALR